VIGNKRKGGKDGTFLFTLDHSCVKFCNDFMMDFPLHAQRRRLRQAWWCWSLSLAPSEDCGKEGGRKEAAGVVREERGVLAS
jgi:hypothetical protein